MYITRYQEKSQLVSIDKLEGEPIEKKVARIQNEKEPITDSAPLIFTERKEGVKAAYNVRTDRFEIAAEAMDKVSASHMAKRQERHEPKVIPLNPDGGDEGGGKAEPSQ